MQNHVYIKSDFVQVSDATGRFLYENCRDHVFETVGGAKVHLHPLDLKVRIGHDGPWHRPRLADALSTGVSIRVDGKFVVPNMTGRFVDDTFVPEGRKPMHLVQEDHLVEVRLGRGTSWMRDAHLWRVLEDTYR